MNFHHIGIATKDINVAIKDYQRLYKIKDKSIIVFDKEQDATLALIRTEAGLSVEFISGKIVENIINKGIQYYHICYEVDQLKDEIRRLTDLGARLISRPKPAILFEMRQVAFLSTPQGLIELLEK